MKTQAMNRVRGILAALTGVLAVAAAADTWCAAENTGMEDDVLNTGYPVYAYGGNGSGYTYNDVNFAMMPAGNGTVWNTNVELSPGISGNYSSYFTNDVPVQIRRLLSEARYGSGSAMTMLLKNLQAGSKYRVQLFFNDARGAYGGRYAEIDGARVYYGTNKTHGATFPFGGNLTGTFTATAAVHQVDIAYSSGAQQLNALSLFRLPEEKDLRLWTLQNVTTNVTDVDTRGAPLGAWGRVAASLNGVAFRPFTSVTGMLKGGDRVEIVLEDGRDFSSTTEEYKTNLPADLDAEYKKLLQSGYYRDGSTNATITLKKLVPAARYLLQIWVSDSRDTGRVRAWQIDQALQVRYNVANSAPYGQIATCVFFATAAEMEFPVKVTAGTCFQINALQLREMPMLDARQETWAAAPLTGADTDIANEGTGVFAYLCAGNKNPADFTVNGVTFTSRTMKENIDNRVFLSEPFLSWLNSFSSFTDVPMPYFNLLKCGSYGFASSADIVYTIPGLDVGYDYLVQLVFSDTRETEGLERWASAGGATTYFDGSIDPTYRLGGSLTGRFTASSTSNTSFVVTYTSKQTLHLNAIQLRRLGFTGLLRTTGGTWDTTGAGWSRGVTALGVQDTPWDAANGSTNTAGVTGISEITLAEDVWMDALSAQSPLTVNGAGHTLNVGCSVYGPDTRVNAAWGSVKALKRDAGRLTLAGDCPALAYVLVGDGTLAFATSPTNDLDITLSTSGALEVAEGEALRVASLAGDGTVRGAGRLTVRGPEPLRVSGALACDGITWDLEDGASLFFTGDADLSDDRVYVADPRAACVAKRVVVEVEGVRTGTPLFTFPDTNWKAKWNAAANGYHIVPRGSAVVFMR